MSVCLFMYVVWMSVSVCSVHLCVMYVFIFMHVCRVCPVYMCLSVCSVCVCVYLSTYVHVCINICMCVYVCRSLCVYAHVCRRCSVHWLLNCNTFIPSKSHFRISCPIPIPTVHPAVQWFTQSLDAIPSPVISYRQRGMQRITSICAIITNHNWSVCKYL